jgi:hypothetical protein
MSKSHVFSYSVPVAHWGRNFEVIKTMEVDRNIIFLFIFNLYNAGGGVQLGFHSAPRPPIGLLCSLWWLWWWRNWYNDDWQEKPRYSEKTCLSAALSTTNPTCCPVANPDRHGGKLATNRLRYGAAWNIIFLQNIASNLPVYTVS